jgi:hypothetical protein
MNIVIDDSDAHSELQPSSWHARDTICRLLNLYRFRYGAQNPPHADHGFPGSTPGPLSRLRLTFLPPPTSSRSVRSRAETDERKLCTLHSLAPERPHTEELSSLAAYPSEAYRGLPHSPMSHGCGPIHTTLDSTYCRGSSISADTLGGRCATSLYSLDPASSMRLCGEAILRLLSQHGRPPVDSLECWGLVARPLRRAVLL